MLDDIGAGRFGPMYRARAGTDDSQIAAVKVFDQGLSPERAAALAQALGRLCQAPLDHPSIVPPIDSGSAGDLAWLAEAYVDGTPLDIIIGREGPQPLADVLLRITQVAGALDFAAAVGTFHGALHPRDILVAGDRTLLTGLGVVQALSDAGLDVPMSGPCVSPQRENGLPVRHADDIFALAAITFEVLYGRPLSNRARLGTLVTPLTGIDHTRLREVLEGSLSDDPQERPGTALEFAGALQGVIGEKRIPIPIRDSRLRDSDSQSDSVSGISMPMPTPTPIPVPEATSPVDDLPLRPSDPIVEPGIIFDGPQPDWEAGITESAITESDLTASRVPESRIKEPGIPESRIELGIAEFTTAASEPASASELRGRNSESESGRRNSDSGSESASHRGGSVWLALMAGLAIGLLGGFGAGFIVGQRDATPVPRSAERAVPRAQREAPPAAESAPATGQDFTESTVPAVPVEEPEVKPTEPPLAPAPGGSVPPRTTANEARTSTDEPRTTSDERRTTNDERRSTANAFLEVVSRPAGAQVFLDERLVGKTPLVMSDVRPGTHAVRIVLPGHKRWATKVEVAGGTRARVAASLER